MEFHTIPQPHEITPREREDATGAYLMMFATSVIGLPLPILNMVASIVYYFVNRSKGRFVQFHALQSMYSQIIISCINSYLTIWVIVNLIKKYPFTEVFWGFLVVAAIGNIIYFIFSIIAAVKANKGRFYYFVFFGRLSFVQVYQKRDEKQETPVNLPPKL